MCLVVYRQDSPLLLWKYNCNKLLTIGTKFVRVLHLRWWPKRTTWTCNNTISTCYTYTQTVSVARDLSHIYCAICQMRRVISKSRMYNLQMSDPNLTITLIITPTLAPTLPLTLNRALTYPSPNLSKIAQRILPVVQSYKLRNKCMFKNNL